jgi:protease I
MAPTLAITGSPGIKDDLINAGAIWEDAPVVVDGHFVSSRRPDDLPEFCTGILQAMESSRRAVHDGKCGSPASSFAS